MGKRTIQNRAEEESPDLEDPPEHLSNFWLWDAE